MSVKLVIDRIRRVALKRLISNKLCTFLKMKYNLIHSVFNYVPAAVNPCLQSAATFLKYS